MKTKKREINGVKITRFEFEDGSVWEEVDLPPEWYQGPDVSKSPAPEASVQRLSTAKLKRFKDDEQEH